MIRTLNRRRAALVLALAAILIAVPLIVVNLNAAKPHGLPWAAQEKLNAPAEDAGAAAEADKDFQESSQGVENGGAGGEAFEAQTAAEQFAEARTSPTGIVPAGGYTTAYNQLTGLGVTGAD